ncbi:MAG TPA: prepilin peptidase [Pirellulales bacterium]|nr:prepilin peptidase [Pirellulales bacterium]
MILDRLLDPDMPAPLVWFVLVWLFAVGACIGSFMNVVIYRLPAGLSLLHPPSRCPACKTPIRAADNVPIFGWIWLRGRCRQCRASISARYPAVELLVALLFVGLAWAELLSPEGKLALAGLTMAESWGVYAYHVFLLCSLTCGAFIEFDGHPLPARLTVPTLIVGLAAPLVWPHLRPLAVPDGNALADGVIGAAAGTALALACWPATFVSSTSRTMLRDFAVTLASVGAFLGWQSVSGVAVIAAALRLATAVVGRGVQALRRIGYAACVFPAALGWIVLWKALLEQLPWMGAEARPTTWLAAVASVAVLSLVPPLPPGEGWGEGGPRKS